MLYLPSILSLIFMGGSRIRTSKILPILDLFTGTLTSLDHVLILADIESRINSESVEYWQKWHEIRRYVKVDKMMSDPPTGGRLVKKLFSTNNFSA